MVLNFSFTLSSPADLNNSLCIQRSPVSDVVCQDRSISKFYDFLSISNILIGACVQIFL